jgi:hypothetical protein
VTKIDTTPIEEMHRHLCAELATLREVNAAQAEQLRKAQERIRAAEAREVRAWNEAIEAAQATADEAKPSKNAGEVYKNGWHSARQKILAAIRSLAKGAQE